LLGRTSIPSCSSLLGYATYKNIVGTKTITTTANLAASLTGQYGTGFIGATVAANQTAANTPEVTTYTLPINNANPAFILYDLLVTFLKMSPALIDSASFESAAATLYQEKLGLNMIINTSKKGLDWIQEILRYTHGILYLNSLTGKYYYKLLRLDYNITDLPNVDIDIADDIKITRGSRAELPNTFTFKYQNITGNETPKLDTVSMTNQANVTAAGFINNTTIDLSCINTDEALNLLASFNFKKLSYPLANLTFKISPFDFPSFIIGSAFTFSDVYLTDNKLMVFRVVKVTGDAVKDAYFTIEAMEDVFSLNHSVTLPASSVISLAPTYQISTAPNRVKIFPVTRENSVTKAVHVAATYSGTAYISSLKAYETSSQAMSSAEWKYGTVTAITPGDGTALDRTLVIRVENLDADMYAISGTEADLQRIVNTAYWGEEAIAFKTVAQVSPTIFEFTGILRGIQDKTTTHSIGEDFWVSPYSGNQQPTLSITSLTPTIKVYAENQYSTSPETSVAYTYTNSVETPYSVNSVKVIEGIATATLEFSPCVRLAGANYRNCDTVLAGEDEGKVEGIFNIYKDTTLLTTITPPSYTTSLSYVVNSPGNYYVETQLGAYKSIKTLATITVANLGYAANTSNVTQIFGDTRVVNFMRFEGNCYDEVQAQTYSPAYNTYTTDSKFGTKALWFQANNYLTANWKILKNLLGEPSSYASFVFSYWINSQSTSQGAVLFTEGAHSGSNNSLEINNTRIYYTNGVGAVTNVALTNAQNTWTNIIIRVDDVAKTMKVYQNSVLLSTFSYDGALVYWSGVVGQSPIGTYRLNAYLDGVRVVRGICTDEEILQIAREF
jgi:hypothetical protein